MKKNMFIEEWIVAILVIVMVLMVTAQVLSRYILHTSLSHTEELVRYLFVWATFLGIAAAAYRNRHLSIAVSQSLMPSRYLKWAGRATAIGALLFAITIIFFGVRVVLLQFGTRQTTAALGMPMWIIGLAIPVCSALLVLHLILGAVKAMKGNRQ